MNSFPICVKGTYLFKQNSEAGLQSLALDGNITSQGREWQRLGIIKADI